MDDNQKLEIGKRLIELRKNKGLTQLEVSQATEINRTTINNYELGVRKVKLDDVIILSKLYSTTTDYILTGVQAENRNIYEVTGLTDNSLKMLEMIQNNIKNNVDTPFHESVIRALNNILNYNNIYNTNCFPIGWYLLSAISEYLDTDFKDKTKGKNLFKYKSIGINGDKVIFQTVENLENVCKSNILGLLKFLKSNIHK